MHYVAWCLSTFYFACLCASVKVSTKCLCILISSKCYICRPHFKESNFAHLHVYWLGIAAALWVRPNCCCAQCQKSVLTTGFSTPDTLSGGAVAGIIIVLLVVVVAVVAAGYARYRQMFCFGKYLWLWWKCHCEEGWVGIGIMLLTNF